MRNSAAERLLSTARREGVSIAEDSFARLMDAADPLREHRASFSFPRRRDGADFVYVSSNSLGLQHRDVESGVTAALRKWRDFGAHGCFQHINSLFEFDSHLCRKEMAGIVGAQESEVFTMDTCSFNLQMLLTAFYRPQGKKRRIMMETHGLLATTRTLMSQLEAHGMNPSEDILFVSAQGHEGREGSPVTIPLEHFLSVIAKSDDVAVLIVSAVHFVTGQLFDIPAITKAAHAKGILVGVDCSHAAGNVPLRLHDWGVDFACWCTHRYLNGGPNNLAGVFVHARHTRLGGALRELRPAEGAAVLRPHGPSPLNTTALLPSLRLLDAVGIAPLREKSTLLTSYMELLLGELLPPGSAQLITPAHPEQRGAQLSLRVMPNRLPADFSLSGAYGHNVHGDTDAEQLKFRLCEKGVLAAHFPPDVLLLAPAPLYNSFMDVLVTVRAIADCFLGI